jgi:hypothetical protein
MISLQEGREEVVDRNEVEEVKGGEDFSRRSKWHTDYIIRVIGIFPNSPRGQRLVQPGCGPWGGPCMGGCVTELPPR